MADSIIFTDTASLLQNFPELAQGPAKLATAEDIEKDQEGYTHPNLHRRIDDSVQEPGELTPREYSLSIGGVNSYRTTSITVHEEGSTTSEIP